MNAFILFIKYLFFIQKLINLDTMRLHYGKKNLVGLYFILNSNTV